VEAAHTTALGARGISQKSADYSAIPLCLGHHRGNADSYHSVGERKFVEMHGLDIQELVGSLISLYRVDCDGATAPESGHFAAYTEEESNSQCLGAKAKSPVGKPASGMHLAARLNSQDIHHSKDSSPASTVPRLGIAKQDVKAFLLKVTVIGQNIVNAFAPHRLHGNAVCQAVAFIESPGVEF
jgi:hypothetical protein